MVRQRYPSRSADRIPVVYVTTPPKGSPRKLAMEFARFLGLPPVKRGYNTTDIADVVCQIMLAAQVDGPGAGRRTAQPEPGYLQPWGCMSR